MLETEGQINGSEFGCGDEVGAKMSFFSLPLP